MSINDYLIQKQRQLRPSSHYRRFLMHYSFMPPKLYFMKLQVQFTPSINFVFL